MIRFTSKQKAIIARRIKRGFDGMFTEKGRQRQFAIRLGVSPSTVSRWLVGKVTPNMRQLIAISEVFDTPLHKLCGFSGRRPVKTRNMAFNNIMNLSIGKEHAIFTDDGIERTIGKILDKIRKQADG